jgi:hypothetical protein
VVPAAGDVPAALECVPVASSCPTPSALETSALWAIVRLPFSDVPSTSLFLNEAAAGLDYHLDAASVQTYPLALGQLALRNFAPFEQFLTAKVSKRLFTIFTFTWFAEIRPGFFLAANLIPSVIFTPVQTLLTALLTPVAALLDSIVPGLGALVPSPAALPTLTLSQFGIEIPMAVRGSVIRTEDLEVVTSYSITTPPQTHILGRTIAHFGRSTVPFTVDINRYVQQT